MVSEDRYTGFIDGFHGLVKRNEPLSAYTTFRTGGGADLFVDVADAESLVQAIRLAREFAIPYFIIGGGSNLLVSDDGYRGLIIRNRIRRLEVQGNEVQAGAGELLDRVVDFAAECSLTGLEFAAGIWGTVGGAICGNAGAFGSQIGSLLAHAELVDADGNLRQEGNDYFRFAYRYSILKATREIITYACLALAPGERSEIVRRTEDIRRLRREKHPVTPCSAGCFFKNVERGGGEESKLPAGKLLEEVGGKEMRVGGAAVFPGHANIIVNTGHATSKDIRQLADILKERVRERFKIELQEEVISVGNV
jgi:UDP-N-acetylmuramate dehydrogenase